MKCYGKSSSENLIGFLFFNNRNVGQVKFKKFKPRKRRKVKLQLTTLMEGLKRLLRLFEILNREFKKKIVLNLKWLLENWEEKCSIQIYLLVMTCSTCKHFRIFQQISPEGAVTSKNQNFQQLLNVFDNCRAFPTIVEFFQRIVGSF